MYWALTAIFTFFQSKLEARMSKGYVREALQATSRKTRWMTGATPGPGTPGAGAGTLGATAAARASATMIEVPEPAETEGSRTEEER
jgi:hypothetical protein